MDTLLKKEEISLGYKIMNGNVGKSGKKSQFRITWQCFCKKLFFHPGISTLTSVPVSLSLFMLSLPPKSFERISIPLIPK